MKHNGTLGVAIAFGALTLASQALAAPVCGASTGEKATGEPIVVGGIHGNAPPGDWTSSTDTASAYFKCVNDNGGIHGRPIDYRVENDAWNPEAAAQAAAKLVHDANAVAMVANGSFIEMAVNAGTYKDANIMVMASACAISECFESSNIVSTNQGPLPSTLGAVMYAREELGGKDVACIGLNIPNSGNYTCDDVARYVEKHGGTATSVFMNPGAPDVNSALLEAISSGADTMAVALPAGLALAMFKAAEEQDLRDSYNWVTPTPLYDLSIPDAIGEYWHGHVYVNAELAPFQVNGPDLQNWKSVMDAYANADDPRDTFGQAGYLSAKYFVDTMLAMDPADVGDRAKVSDAIRAIKGYTSDMMCGPYYVGNADFHMPNHAGYMLKIVKGGFEIVRDCYEFESAYFDRILDEEKKLGLR